MERTADSEQTQDLVPGGAAETRLHRHVKYGWIVLAAVVALYAYQQVLVAWRFMHGNDFRHLYLGAAFLKHGLDPYDEIEFLRYSAIYFPNQGINPYVYPPTTGLALRFLTFWPWATAARVWFGLNQLLLVASLLICIRLFLGFRDPWRLAVVALLAATSFPLRRTFTAGQLNCALLLIYCGLCWAIVRRQAWLAGLLVGFGILFKLVPGVFVVYFLWKRRWRELAWTGGWFAVILAASAALAGWKVHAAYGPVMRAMGYGKSVWEARLIRSGIEPFYRDAFNQSPNALFHHLLARDPVAREDPAEVVRPWADLGARGPKAANLATVLVSLGLLMSALWAMRSRRRDSPPPPDAVPDLSQSAIRNPQSAISRDSQSAPNQPSSPDERTPLEICLMILLSLLLPSILWDHYVVALFLPQIVLFSCYVKGHRRLSWKLAVLVLASALLAVPIGFDQPGFHHGVGILGMSAKLFGVLVLFALTVAALADVPRDRTV